MTTTVQTIAIEIKTKLDLLIGKIDICKFRIAGEEINTILDDLLKKIPPLAPVFKQSHTSSTSPAIQQLEGACSLNLRQSRNTLSLDIGGFQEDLEQIKSDYVAFKKTDSNLLMMIAYFFVVLLSVDLQAIRNSLEWKPSVCFLITWLCLVFSMFNRLMLLSHKYDIRSLQPFFKGIMQLKYIQLANDSLIIFGSASASIFLFIEVINGSNICYFVGINCKESKVDIFPTVRLICTVTIVLLYQSSVKSSCLAVVLGWIISVVFTNLSLYSLKSNLFTWVKVNCFFFFLCVSYELERHTLRHFIDSIIAMRISETNIHLNLSETNRQISEKLEIAKQQITEGELALESERAIVRHITHEVRTPLNTVAIGADVLLIELEVLGDQIPELLIDIVAGMRDASVNALEVVNDLLSFEKIAAGMFTIQTETTPLLEFLKRCMKNHFIPALAKDIKFSLTPSSLMSGDINIDIDSVKMAVVMKNLFSNAIKFTKKGGVVSVDVTTKHVDGVEKVVIGTKDNGVGITAENLGQIFREGVQINANELQNGGGSGFGLFISKAIADLHEGGRIWVESAGEMMGTIFFVELTVSKASFNTQPSKFICFEQRMVSENNLSSSKSILSDDVDLSPLPPLRILVVDDSVGNRKMLIRMLNMLNIHDCIQCEDGLAAVSEISRSMIDSNTNSCKSSRKSSISYSTPTSENGRNNSTRKSISVKTKSTTPTSENGRSKNRTLSVTIRSECIMSNLQTSSMDMDTDTDDSVGLPFDMVLMDNSMPTMSGSDAAMAMRTLGFKGPIIGITGNEDTTGFMSAGADMVLLKPINKKILFNAMKTVIETRQDSDEKYDMVLLKPINKKFPYNAMKTMVREKIARQGSDDTFEGLIP